MREENYSKVGGIRSVVGRVPSRCMNEVRRGLLR